MKEYSQNFKFSQFTSQIWRSYHLQQWDHSSLLWQIPLNNNINKSSCLHCSSHYEGTVWLAEIESRITLFQIRVIMLKTDLLPYDDVADLFIIDPDGFIIRKWNSKQLNNGLMTAEFQVTSIISSLHRNNIFLF